MWMIRAAVAVILIGYTNVGYSATVECEGEPYEQALCWYTAGEWDRAEVGFERIVEEGPREPELLKAIYFLARTKMEKRSWDDAAALWRRLFELSPAFYRDWSGDFLLGVCRKAQGRD